MLIIILCVFFLLFIHNKIILNAVRSLVSAPDGDITYDSKGNITVHDAAGVYGYDPARPYALSQITLTASGFPSSEQAVSYNSMNRPIGQSFIFDRPNIEGYTIPVTNFPVNLLNKVYK